MIGVVVRKSQLEEACVKLIHNIDVKDSTLVASQLGISKFELAVNSQDQQPGATTDRTLRKKLEYMQLQGLGETSSKVNSRKNSLNKGKNNLQQIKPKDSNPNIPDVSNISRKVPGQSQEVVSEPIKTHFVLTKSFLITAFVEREADFEHIPCIHPSNFFNRTETVVDKALKSMTFPEDFI